MLFPSWLQNRNPADAAKNVRRDRVKPGGFRPGVEALEGRVVLSTLSVTNNLGFGPGSLRDEINLAQGGDTIVFSPSLSGQTIQLAGGNGPIELLVTKNLTIQGPGAGKLAIDANAVARVFEIAQGAQVSISGLTIEDGRGRTGAFDPSPNDYYGGGILNEGTLTLSGCTVTGNSTSNSGPGEGGGGGIANFGTMTMSGCTVTGNTAGSVGGGVYNRGTLTVVGSTVTNNTAFYGKYDDFYNTGTLSASSSTIGNKKYK
jgi:hypothetical protein